MLHIIWSVSTRETQWDQPRLCISFQSKVIGKNSKTVDDLCDLGWPFKWPLGVNSPLESSHVRWKPWLWKNWVISIRLLATENNFIFPPLVYNGEVTSLTWPQVTSIKNPRYTNHLYWYPYAALKRRSWSRKNCGSDRLSNFFWGGVTWPRLVTWPEMTWGQKNYTVSAKDALTGTENFAALRAAVFSLSWKNLRGGAFRRPPRPGAG